MKAKDLPEQHLPAPATATFELAVDPGNLLVPLLQAPVGDGRETSSHRELLHGVHVGELLALQGNGGAPLVRCVSALGAQAVVARSTVDLHGAHVGRAVLLAFEAGDAQRPIVLGVLRESVDWPLPERPDRVEVDADGQRLVVNAKEQLVLRCGQASITLTKAGKVTIEGSYVSSRSTGVNRVKGGSVQLN